MDFIGDVFEDTAGFLVNNYDDVINHVVDFTSLSVGLVKGIISLFPICAKIMKNLLPLLQHSLISFKQIIILLPFLSVMYGIALFIKEIEREEK